MGPGTGAPDRGASRSGHRAEEAGDWIVLPDGTQVGIASTGDVRTRAPMLDVQSLTAIDDGQTIVAQRLSGDSAVLG